MLIRVITFRSYDLLSLQAPDTALSKRLVGHEGLCESACLNANQIIVPPLPHITVKNSERLRFRGHGDRKVRGNKLNFDFMMLETTEKPSYMPRLPVAPVDAISLRFEDQLCLKRI
jgi:hypothetical protein